MGSISFNVELNGYLKLTGSEAGTQAIQIRVTKDRIPKRVGVEVRVKAVDWNPIKKEVRKSDPQYRQKNALIKSKILELELLHQKSELRGRVVTAESLIRQSKKKVLGDNFFLHAASHIEKLDSAASRAGQTSVVKKLRDFWKSDVLLFGEIDRPLLDRYRKHLKKIGNELNTIHSNMGKLEGIYNEAVGDGHFTPEGGSPFDRMKLKTTKSKRVKLTLEEIEMLHEYQIKPEINAFHTKNLFLFSYYQHGVRFADALQITWSQIRNGRYEFTARKTEKTRSLKLHPRAMEILEHYQHTGENPNAYVFPFLKHRQRERFSEDEWFKITSSVNAKVNWHLKNIALKAGIQPFSFHSARHTFANNARLMTDNDIFAISEAMDHSSISVTQNYFAEGDNDENDAFSDRVYGGKGG